MSAGSVTQSEERPTGSTGKASVAQRLVLLLVLCLLSRAVMAWKLGGLCPDGVYYVRLAQSLDQGNVTEAIQQSRLNPLPIVLVVLHRAGIDWELAGNLWGVFMAGLVVLPLWGWLRRQFDDRVALAGCFLYAVHSEMIRWSPEVIRDPTFWFLFTSALYLLWRAVTEVRLRLFFAAAVAVAAASVTRFEGLLLLIPLALWSAARWRQLKTAGPLKASRGRLAIGALACLTILPAAAALGWFVFRHGGLSSDGLALRPFILAGEWARTMAAPMFGSASGHSSVLPPTLAPISLGRMLEIYLPTVAKGITPLWGAMFVVGAVRVRSMGRRADRIALALVAVALFAAIWIHLWVGHFSCKRYVFPFVLMGSGFAGLGGLRLSAWATARLQRLGGVAFAAWGPATLCGGVALALAFAFSSGSRTEEVALGHWIGQQARSAPVLLGPNGLTQVVNYYAGGRCDSFLPTTGDDTITALTQQNQPDFVLLPQDQADFLRGGPLVRRLEAAGVRPLDRGRLPANCSRVLVLTKRQGLDAMDWKLKAVAGSPSP